MAGGLERYFPDRPDISNMTPLAQYDAFLILITQPVTCTMPVAPALGRDPHPAVGRRLAERGWSGDDGTPPAGRLRLRSGQLRRRLPLGRRGLERYFPGRPDISNMGPLNKYDAFLILLTAPVNCAMPIAP